VSLPVPASLQLIAGRTERRMVEVLDAERARWAAFDPGLGELVGEIARLTLGAGKRLRPAFCHWGYVAAGADGDDPRVIDAGAALELMHAFALFHDDVMDGAATRRGRPTTHTVFAELHAAQQWAGESRRFGEGVAILVGDLAFVYADRLMTGVPEPAWEVWNELRVELNVGQLLDIVGTAGNDRRVAQAERICRYKSGKYTIERPLHLGAALAGRADLFDPLSAYGLPLGDAFQMRDDVLGAFGDPTVTGKPVGADLREGKPTPLLAMAVEAADPVQRTVLDLVGRTELDDEDILHVQQAIVASGALVALEARIGALAETAVAAIEVAPIEPSARAALVELAAYVARRDV
jgi:geranylgeranyl diphosphate synthase, type I